MIVINGHKWETFDEDMFVNINNQSKKIIAVYAGNKQIYPDNSIIVKIDNIPIHSNGFSDIIIGTYISDRTATSGNLTVVYDNVYHVYYNGIGIHTSSYNPSPIYEPRMLRWYVNDDGLIFLHLSYPEGAPYQAGIISSALDPVLLGMNVKYGSIRIG